MIQKAHTQQGRIFLPISLRKWIGCAHRGPSWKKSVLFLVNFLCVVGVNGPERALASSAPQEEGWRIYVNDRYQYQICYPYRVLKPQGEPDNGDGQRFLAADGGEMSVVGWYNVLDWSLLDNVRSSISLVNGKNVKVTYQVIKKDWAVYSGVSDPSNEFYGKVMLRDGRFLRFHIEYPVSKRNKYKSYIENIQKCFVDNG